MPTMLELGRRYGGLAWTCERAFQTVGSWVADTADPAWQVRFADHCHRLAFHAERLRWLVPEIAGRSVADQLAPLPGLAELPPLATTAPEGRAGALAALWEAVSREYEAVLEEANPVSDGPAIRWLRLLAADAADARSALPG